MSVADTKSQITVPDRIGRLLAVCLVIVIAGLIPLRAAAQTQNPVVIRDTEIERMLAKWSKPAIEAAGLRPDNVNIILVRNPAINAFVAGGPNVFFYTGLLRKTDGPGEVVGVMAHELGHIRGGHLVRARDAMEKASYEALLSTVIGLGAAIATGNAEVAAAASTAGQSMARRGFLKFSRVQESTADQAALTYLRRADLPAKGLATFLEKLGAQELLPAGQQSEYVRTHPLTRNRIEAIQNAISDRAYPANQMPPEWVADHKRMTAKLEAFLHPERIDPVSKPPETATPRLYAAAIAAYRTEDYETALDHLTRLIEREPDNAYFYELKGQLLVDAGKVDKALSPYGRAVNILPEAPLIRTALAHALIAAGGQEGKDKLKKAITHLEAAAKHSDRNPRIYRLLATAHGRLGNEGLARLYLAEEAFLQNRFGDARRHAGAAQTKLDDNSPKWQRARDLKHFSKQAAKQKEKG